MAVYRESLRRYNPKVGWTRKRQVEYMMASCAWRDKNWPEAEFYTRQAIDTTIDNGGEKTTKCLHLLTMLEEIMSQQGKIEGTAEVYQWRQRIINEMDGNNPDD